MRVGRKGDVPSVGIAGLRTIGGGRAYEQTETIADLVPAIVGAFLESARAFLKWRRQLADPDG